MPKQIFILSGTQGEGKTTRCLEIVQQLKARGESIGGIVALGFWENNARSGFDLMDIRNHQKIPFAKREAESGWLKIKGFYFNPKAIKEGESILRLAVQQNDWIIIDEIGKLDTKGYLWSSVFTELIKIPNKNWIICVRDIFVDEVIEKWKLKSVKILKVSDKFS
jgi:nucleoside-triphosphatase THEP1